MKGKGAQTMIWRGRVAVVVFASIAGGASAQAHLVNTGLGPFYDGVLHLALSPDQLLGVVGLALLAGLSGAPYGRLMLFTLPLAWLAGGIVGMTGRLTLGFPAATGLGLLVIGILVAWDRELPVPARPFVPLVFGGIAGVANGAVAAGGALQPSGLLGIVATAFVLVALLSALTVWLADRPPWARIVVRVAGSWIAAIGLLMTGWALR